MPKSVDGMTRKDAARYLQINTDTLRNAVKNNQIDLIGVGKKTLLCMKSLELYKAELEERRRLRITSDKWINRGDIL